MSLKELFVTGILQESRNPLKLTKYVFLSLCLFLSLCFHAVKGIRLEPTYILSKWPYSPYSSQLKPKFKCWQLLPGSSQYSKIDFESQILALFDTSPLHQFSIFKNFLSIFLPLPWNLDNPYYLYHMMIHRKKTPCPKSALSHMNVQVTITLFSQ